MEVDKQGGTGLRVIEGKVAFKSKDTGDEVMVGAGQSSIVMKGKSPTKPTAAKTGGVSGTVGTAAAKEIFQVTV